MNTKIPIILFGGALVYAIHARADAVFPPVPNPQMWQLPTNILPTNGSDEDASFAYNNGVVSVTGLIEAETPLMLDYKIKTYHWNVKAIVLNSRGGNVNAAFELAGMVSKYHWSTSTDYCASACTVVWAAGLHKYATNNAQIGVHESYNELSFGNAVNIVSSKRVADYLRHHGAPQNVVYHTMFTSPDNTYWLTREDIASWK